MIQIITNNKKKYDKFSEKKFLISKIDDFQSFDNYEIIPYMVMNKVMSSRYKK